VPLGPSVRGIQILKEQVQALAAQAGITGDFISEPFDHLSQGLSEQDI
jgi:phycobilisome core component